MLTDSEVLALKDKWGDLYNITHGTQDFTFRTLTLAEYQLVLGSTFEGPRLDRCIAEWCVLYPKVPLQWDDYPLDSESILSENIILRSQFPEVATLMTDIEAMRVQANKNPLMLLAGVLARATGKSPSQYANLTYSGLLREVAFAEVVAGPIITPQTFRKKGGRVNVSPGDPSQVVPQGVPMMRPGNPRTKSWSDITDLRAVSAQSAEDALAEAMGGAGAVDSKIPWDRFRTGAAGTVIQEDRQTGMGGREEAPKDVVDPKTLKPLSPDTESS